MCDSTTYLRVYLGTGCVTEDILWWRSFELSLRLCARRNTMEPVEHDRLELYSGFKSPSVVHSVVASGVILSASLCMVHGCFRAVAPQCRVLWHTKQPTNPPAHPIVVRSNPPGHSYDGLTQARGHRKKNQNIWNKKKPKEEKNLGDRKERNRRRSFVHTLMQRK